MEDAPPPKRISWMTRAFVKPTTRDALYQMSRDDMVPVAYLVGKALDQFITERSST